MLIKKEIMSILGSPVSNVELTEEQIRNGIKLAQSQTIAFIKIYDCPKLKDYILDKLIIINCKKILAQNLNKYSGFLPDGLEITNHSYMSAIEDEKILINLLKDCKTISNLQEVNRKLRLDINRK